MLTNELYRDPSLSWFGKKGEADDIVLASRVRLARNLAELPFPNRADMHQLARVQGIAADCLTVLEEAVGQEINVLQIDALTQLERTVLLEKQLISRNLLKKPEYRSAFLSKDKSVSLLINEEDHFRIQCMAPGLNLQGPFQLASRIDDTLEAKENIAFDEKLGYLTSCPTNLGTGLRAAVLVHLPGLVFTHNIHNIISISQQLGLSVRGLYGDDNETVGNIYQISNQLTLGFTEESIIENLTNAVTEICEHERRARKALMLYSKDKTEDIIWRAYGVLCYARSLEETETLGLLSQVRLGVDLDLIHELQAEDFADLILASRPSYLSCLAGNENMSPTELAKKRAQVMRSMLRERQPETGF